jgi:TonB-dependent receptor
MNTKTASALLLCAVALCATALPSAHATQSGSPALSPGLRPTLIGTVTNQATGRTLEGARVVLQGTGRETLTDEQGTYRFDDIAPGNVTVSVSYTGLKTLETPFVVAASGTSRRDIELTSDIYTLSRLVVSGEREGNAQAITLQKKSFGVKNVVSQDAFGSLAGNPADLLVRLPGVSGIEQDGDVRYIQIRGLSGSLSSVTRDGNRMADASSTSREYLFQQATSDAIERFEVVKSPTPDMDADSIGGSVNMITKSAFDSRAGRRISATVGLVWRALDEREDKNPRLNYTAAYSDVFGGRLGVSFSYGARKHYNPINVTSSSYQNVVPDPAYLYSFQTSDFRMAKEREAGDLKLDYKLSDATRLSLGLSASNYFEHFTINNAQYTTAQAIAVPGPNGTFIGTGAILPGFTNTVTEWRPSTATTVNVNGYDAGIKKGANHAQLSAFHKYPRLEIDYNGYYSGSRVHSGPSDRFAVIARNVGLRFERPDSANHLPTLIQTAGPSITDINSYTENQYTSADNRNKEKYWGAALNVRKDFALVVPAWIKAGLRLRAQDRDLKSNPWTGTYVGTDGVMGLNAATSRNDDNLAQFVSTDIRSTGTFLDRYPKVPYPLRPDTYRNPGKGLTTGATSGVNPGSLFMARPELFRRNLSADLISTLTGRQSFTEEIKAGYLMGSFEVGRLTVLGGLRMEDTKTEGEGALQQLTSEERARRAAWVGPVTDAELTRRTTAEYGGRRVAKGDYRSVFPGIHFKYTPLRNVIARASYSSNIGRPAIGQLIPRTTVDDISQTISTSNPSLKPQFADNFDVGVDYYFEPVGMVSAGVFLKEMKDFIYTQSGITVGQGADNGFGGDFAGYRLTTQLNGGFAKVKGFELAYQQQLTFLPGWWSGFGVYANFTKIETEGNYGGATTVTSNEVADFVPETFNLGISYIRDRLSVRAQYNRRAGYLQAFNAAQARLRYAGRAETLNVKTVYQLSKRFSVYLDVSNIFKDPDRNWSFYGNRAGYLAEINSPLFSFGTTARF